MPGSQLDMTIRPSLRCLYQHFVAQLPPLRPKDPRRRMAFFLFVRILQINPLLSFDIHRQGMVFEFGLTGLLRHMHMDNALVQGALNIKLEAQVLGAPFVSFG